MKIPISRQYPLGCAAAAVVGLSLIAPTDAVADVPEEPDVQTSQFVESSSLSVSVDTVAERDDFTVFTGIDECESMVDDGIVDALFETGVNIESDDYFGGIHYYGAPRGDGADISCVDDDDDQHEDCTEIDEDDLSYEGEPASDVEATVAYDELTGLEDEADCEDGDFDRNHYIQLRLRSDAADGTFTEWERSELRLTVDLIRPDVPELSDILVTANSITTEFQESDDEDVTGYYAVYSSESFEAGQRTDEIMDRSPLAIAGEQVEEDVDFEPGETVHVGVVSRDRTGNFSLTGDSMETTVVETDGFWDFYVEQGGAEQGGNGCSAAGASTAGTVVWGAVLALLALTGRLIVGRRRRVENSLSVDNTEVATR